MYFNFFLSSLVGILIYIAPTLADQTYTVQSSTNWGIWEGWGTSLAWWGKVYGDRDDLSKIFFTTTSTTLNGASIPGLGLNIVRYNAGAGSSSTYQGKKMVKSTTIKPWRQLDGFWVNGNSTSPTSSSWDWSVDANQRMALTKARDNGANIFELFSNSPMWWQCKNQNPSGASDGSENILASSLQQHAYYLATIAKHAIANWGITFSTVEPFNEPSMIWWRANGKQEGSYMKPDTQSTIINYLRAELDKQGLSSMKIAASDETSVDQAAATWRALTTDARNNVYRINHHGYEGIGGNRAALYTLASSAGKALWNSEYGEKDSTGVQLVANVMLDLHRLHPTAWSYWQALDSGGWGLIDSDRDAATVGAVSSKYYALAHFTRHIRQGMKILDGGSDTVVAALDSKKNKLIIVAVNFGVAQYLNFDLSKFSGVTNGATVTRWSTQLGETGSRYILHPNDTILSGAKFRSFFSTNVIQTFEVSLGAGN
ncbi:related to Endo-beta-1,6-galactanase [Rhynchosporium agropyri]|uniref:Related to Endo-beta-1,6-galactanase n=1 Tax=Rhynchosporium agropyri TaxID=914238 RepID=A0A1E1KZV5_9HELO|nr:related to Endo-beta-1,6-galactanase [Rhynchosporium agropyri]